MNTRHFRFRTALMMLLLAVSLTSYSQWKGLRLITEEDLRYNLEFLGSREFRGRETPSPELEIATLYIGNYAKHIGLKPILKDGSFYQTVPLTVTSVFQPGTRIVVSGDNKEQVYYFGKAFSGNFMTSGTYRGDVVFAGLGLSDPENGWDDLKDLDLTGKIVIILDAQRPGTLFPLGFTMTGRLTSRINAIRDRGASAVLSIVDPERAKLMDEGQNIFDYIPTGRLDIMYDSQKRDYRTATQPATGEEGQTRPPLPFEKAEISHQLAADLLGVSEEKIAEMFSMTEKGEQVPSIEVSGIDVRLEVEVEKYQSTARNVIAYVEGSDPVLKNEYVVVSGHHDARGIDDGSIVPGADDNGTATVALMSIGKALLAERPKRSVILAWFCGEEQGMNGSQYFVNNCPVPVEKISTCLNMDMIGRNASDSLYLVGSDLLSSELDASINRVNKKSGLNFNFNYLYSNLTHPQRVYFRSDHYPFVRFGIPSVWIFCGFTYDYHTKNDIEGKINYTKFLRTTKLVYLTAYDVGNMKNLLKLDVNPAVTSRGSQNLTESSLFSR